MFMFPLIAQSVIGPDGATTLRNAFDQFAKAGDLLAAPFNGTQPSGFPPMVGIIAAVVGVMLLSGGGKKAASSAKSAGKGLFSRPLVLLAVVAAGWFFLNGGGGGVGL